MHPDYLPTSIPSNGDLHEAARSGGNELLRLLGASRVTPEFRQEVVRFIDSGSAGRIRIEGYAPAIKVTRLLKHVLATAPELELSSIVVRARSGCSDFVGTIQLETLSETRVYEFAWCCRWRAEQEGWTDYFGFPDQMRAAQEYDWRCFRVWEERPGT